MKYSLVLLPDISIFWISYYFEKTPNHGVPITGCVGILNNVAKDCRLNQLKAFCLDPCLNVKHHWQGTS